LLQGIHLGMHLGQTEPPGHRARGGADRHGYAGWHVMMPRFWWEFR
jgi:hypothetical protein